MIKIFECEICKRLSDRKIKGEERFRGTRQVVRKHLVEVHRIKGRKNPIGLTTKEFGQSHITRATLSEVFR